MSKALKQIEKYTRKVLKKLVSQCTQEQQDFFKKIYPEGIDLMNSDKLNTAIQLCERTVIKNAKE